MCHRAILRFGSFHETLCNGNWLLLISVIYISQVDVFENKLITSLFAKPTNRHQYFHFELTKRSLIYIQTLILKRLCSIEKDFKEKLSEMKPWFLKRGYPEQVIVKYIRRSGENIKKSEPKEYFLLLFTILS